jgi:hypothetical protein
MKNKYYIFCDSWDHLWNRIPFPHDSEWGMIINYPHKYSEKITGERESLNKITILWENSQEWIYTIIDENNSEYRGILDIYDYELAHHIRRECDIPNPIKQKLKLLTIK